MSKILVKIGIIIAAIIVTILAYSFITRIFIHKHVENTTETEEQVLLSPEEVIQINILNSTQQTGIADKARNYMRFRGFDVVEIGNYTPQQAHSIVIDRIGDKTSARKVANAMNIPDSLIITKIDSTLFIHASVVLGNDYGRLPAFK